MKTIKQAVKQLCGFEPPKNESYYDKRERLKRAAIAEKVIGCAGFLALAAFIILVIRFFG